MTQSKLHWDVRVQEILTSVRRRGAILMSLGYALYGGGSAAILYFVHDKAFATILVMYFFQLMVLYFGTREMYPAIQGAFRVGLEANRDSVPLFEKLAEGVHRLESDPANHPLVKEIGDRAERVVDEKLMPVVAAWARIGERLEKVTIPQFEKMIAQCGDTERKLDAKVSSAVEGVKRVQQHIEMELNTGIMTEIRQAADAVKMLGMQHVPPPMPTAGPQLGRSVKPASGARDFNDILTHLSKKQNGAPIPVAPQGGRS
jgi:hypothetical protein